MTGTAVAQQTRPGVKEPAGAARSKDRRPIVLASAETMRPSDKSDDGDQARPPKRSVPRVTTCRCGDPAQVEDAEQE